MDKMNEVILATAGYDHKIHFWEPPSGECRSTLSFNDSQARMYVHSTRTGREGGPVLHKLSTKIVIERT